ncbi:Lymphocyte function-associated antigen 3 [Merluccius polli]|uniref:Lymphocyte function-associated antigen 3 n=1 Tax=Merluccius polli TaxID=89951 RepID=A0AA47NCZ8_MERPO|nr:Lymphocyte function-associated antigen 3 [Merluccius polli]
MAVSYFLVCPVLPLLALGQAPQYARQGFETTLGPAIPGTPDRIVWKHGARKVVEFDGSEENVHGTFLDRVVLDWHTAALTIKDLQAGDSGPYELEATINSKRFYSQHEVEVIEKVAVPTISCVLNGTDGSGGKPDEPRTLATLTCSAEGPPSLITYRWTLLKGVLDGRGLLVPLVGKQDETVYTCQVNNPVSQEKREFVAKDCYPGKTRIRKLVATAACRS